MDITTAFLYRMIDQLIYIQISKGSENPTHKKMIYKLLKALHGLKQAPRLWYKQIFQFLFEKLGLKQINADHSIFVTISGINSLIVSTFVDDIKVIGVKRLGHIKKV